MAEYYAQFARGGFGLVISEGTYTDTAHSQGYLNQPGLATDAHVAGWRRVTDAVHATGTPMLAQLMHAGAIVQGNSYATEAIAPSAITADRADARGVRRAGALADTPRDHLCRHRFGGGWLRGGGRQSAQRPGSTVWRSMPPTATCSTSSSPSTPTRATTSTAATVGQPHPADRRGRRGDPQPGGRRLPGRRAAVADEGQRLDLPLAGRRRGRRGDLRRTRRRRCRLSAHRQRGTRLHRHRALRGRPDDHRAGPGGQRSAGDRQRRDARPAAGRRRPRRRATPTCCPSPAARWPTRTCPTACREAPSWSRSTTRCCRRWPRSPTRGHGGGSARMQTEPMTTPWHGGAAAMATLTFDVDAETPILAAGRRYADHLMTMSHQSYGPDVGVPRILDMLDDLGIASDLLHSRLGRRTSAGPGGQDRRPRARGGAPFVQPPLTGDDDRRPGAGRLRARHGRFRGAGHRDPGPSRRAVGCQLADAEPDRRARAGLRLVADGRRPAVRNRHRHNADRGAAGALVARRLGAVRLSARAQHRRGDRVAGQGGRDVARRAGRYAPLPVSVQSLCAPVPFGSAGPDHGAAGVHRVRTAMRRRAVRPMS